MNIIHSIILGIVEGITEFLPVSSTFHLIWTSTLLGISQSEFVKLFEVVIQSGAILAVVLLYWKDILQNFTLFKKLALSFIPTAVVGLVLYKIIKDIFFEQLIATTITFIIVGGIFILVEYLIDKGKVDLKRDIEKLSYKQAIIIGLVQSLAVVPGVSRAGAVMIGMMVMGFKRSESAKYSFMLAIPTILAATVLDLYEMRAVIAANSQAIPFLITGFIAAALSAFIGVQWLIRFLQTNSLVLFGYYRVGVGIILILLMIFSLRA